MSDAGGCASNPDVQVVLMSNEYDDISAPEDSDVVIHASVTSNDNYYIEVFSDTTIVEPYVENLFRIYWVVVYSCWDD